MTKITKPVLCVVTSAHVKGETGISTGFWMAELTHPLAKLRDAGLPVEFASIQGGQAPIDGFDLNDAANARFWDDPWFRQSMRNTLRLADVDASRYSALFFAGGHGTMWDYPQSEAVQRVIRQVYEAGGIISAVCHGPAALVNARLSDGSYLVNEKRLAAFTNDEEADMHATAIVPFLLASALKGQGAIHEPAPNWTAKVVIDGRLITGQNPQSAAAVGEALRDALLA
jgi:putative intracellular protease/amidase